MVFWYRGFLAAEGRQKNFEDLVDGRQRKILDLVPWFFGGRRPPAKFWGWYGGFLAVEGRQRHLRFGTMVSNHLKETVVPIITLSHLR